MSSSLPCVDAYVWRLNDIGTKLYSRGKKDEAMAMYNMAMDTLIRNKEYLQMCDDATMIQKIKWGEDKLKEAKSSRKRFSHPEYPHDVYQDCECQPAPRPLRDPIEAVSVLENGSAVDSNYLKAVILYNRALVHHTENRVKDAEDTYALALSVLTQCTYSYDAITRQVLDPSWASQFAYLAMMIQNNVGHINHVHGELDEALVRFMAAADWSQRFQRCEDNTVRLQVANVLSNFSRTQWVNWYLSESPTTDCVMHDALELVLRMRLLVLDEDDLDVASAHYNYGVFLYEQGNSKCAKHHLEECLKIYKIHREKRRKSSQMINLIPVLSYILLIACEGEPGGDLQSPELSKWLRVLLDTRRQVGIVHSTVARLLNAIGGALFYREDLDYAFEFYREELRIEEALFAPGGELRNKTTKLSVAITMNNLGRVLQEQHRHVEAIVFFQRAVYSELCHKKLEPHIMTWISSGDNVPRPPFSLKDFPGQLLETAYLLSTIWYNLGLVYDVSKKPIQAIRCFQMCLEFRSGIVGPDQPDIACLWYNIGTLQVENGMLHQAVESLGEFLRIRRLGVSCEQDDANLVSVLLKLARLHKKRGNLKQALEAYTQVLEVQRFNMAGDSMHVGMTLCSIAELQHTLGDIDAALDTADQSLRAYLLSPTMRQVTSPNYVTCAQNAGTILLALGSLYHEHCDAGLAHEAYQEATRVLTMARDAARRSGTEETPPPPSTTESNSTAVIDSDSPRGIITLLPLLEVSEMLGRAHCAPQA